MRRKSYREQLLMKVKPKHQKNDVDSLNWIICNKPIFSDISKTKRRQYLQSIIKLEPWVYFNIKFYLSKEVACRIHGMNHAIRVAINVLLIAEERNLKISKLDLIYMGLFHDIGRVNDNRDDNHGERSLQLFDSLIKKNKIFVSDLGSISYGIKMHDVIQRETNITINQDSSDFLNIIKTADALDRYRFPRIDWWINDSYLKLFPSDTLKDIAFEICVRSELEYIKRKKIDYDKIIKKLIAD
ncbi:MAG: HD domain-containing protein [Candidatus Nomurabacteria bacterium]|nr:HD domain-containing protein [Candidatus Nomurabacteria bacterium]